MGTLGSLSMKQSVRAAGRWNAMLALGGPMKHKDDRTFALERLPGDALGAFEVGLESCASHEDSISNLRPRRASAAHRTAAPVCEAPASASGRLEPLTWANAIGRNASKAAVQFCAWTGGDGGDSGPCRHVPCGPSVWDR